MSNENQNNEIKTQESTTNIAYVVPKGSTIQALMDAVRGALDKDGKLPVSDRRIDANRKNCQHSTGPKTVEGKAKSRMNALRNNFTGQKLVMRDDEYIPFFSHIVRFIEDLRPVGAVEEQLVHELAEHHSRMNMLSAVQINMLNLDTMEIMSDYPVGADPYMIEVVGMVETLKNDCGGPKVFDTIGRQEARTTRHMIRLHELLDHRQDRRLKRSKGIDAYDPENCRIYQTAMAQLRYYRELEARTQAEEEERAHEAARRAAEDAALAQQEKEAAEDAVRAAATEPEETKPDREVASLDKTLGEGTAPCTGAPVVSLPGTLELPEISSEGDNLPLN